MKNKIIIDTNLLVLLIVGLYDPQYIPNHRRLGDYSPEDFEILMLFIDDHEIVVTTSVLTEASNLLWYTSEPHKHNIRHLLAAFIASATEHRPESITTAKSAHFLKLGLTDAGILELPADSGLILTVDLDLHIAALERGLRSENFTHHRTFLSRS
ncbi:PIN domain-containing protein [Pseudomonas sp. MWU13-2100]|uniref:PIN domain-containing protein n=1 Tax=Pseudomonas sp. MWU13-2100 TaxID=2935075 RepID=UPI00200D7FE6|nr:PIN domain-containing protein [Pseudomonas sp. MWU13-2100]